MTRPAGGTSHRLQERGNHLAQSLQQHAQLPPFRDIIPAHLHTIVDHRQQGIDHGIESQAEIYTPTSQRFSSASRSFDTSPTQSQGSCSMPSLNEGFEDVSVRSNDAMFAAQAQPMTTMDRGSPWIPSTQYHGMSASYTQPTPRMNQMSAQQLSNRTSPNLPPLRDIGQQRSAAAYDQNYVATNGQMSYVTQAASYPQIYSHTTQPTTDLDNTGFGRSISYDGTPFARFSSYPQTTRSYQQTTPDYGRYSTAAAAAATYDPYHRYGTASTGYRATPYDGIGYSPHALVSSQPASAFGLQGDPNGGHNRRRRGNLPKPVTDILRSWFHDHLEHPYPSEEDKQIFIQKTGLTISQISNWFINARRRHWPALRQQNRDRTRNSAMRRSNSAGGSI